MREIAWKGFQRAGVAILALLWSIAGVAPAADLEPADETTWELPEPDLYDVATQDGQVWAVGYWGTVLHSTDDGESWSERPTPTAETLFAVSFGDVSHGWAVGARGVVLRSEDGGETWRQQRVSLVDEFGEERPLDSDLFDVFAISGNEAWAVGDFGVVLHTTDGETWSQVRLPQEAFPDDNLVERIFNGVEFTDPLHGFIVGEFGTTLRTEDGGQTWTGERELAGVVEDIYLFDVAADGNGSGVAGGTGGVVIGTRDGGARWAAQEAPTTAGLFGAAWQGDRGIVVGDRGVILATRDGGSSWFEPTRPRLFNWLRGADYGDGLAFIVGENGTILRSTDGGESWQRSMGHEPGPTEGISVPSPGGSDLPGRENGATGDGR